MIALSIRVLCNVVAVASLLVGVAALAVYGMCPGNGLPRAAKPDERSLANGVEMFAMETGRAPADFSELVPGYIRALHRDRWGNPYRYARTGQTFSLVSLGKNSEPRSEVTPVTGSLAISNSQAQSNERQSP